MSYCLSPAKTPC